VVNAPELAACFEGIDISFRGMMVRAAEIVWPGNCIGVELVLPDESEPVSIEARVVDLVLHRGDLAMRMVFERPDAAAQRRIAWFLLRQSKQPPQNDHAA
jgi:hypothetical protein